MDFVNNSKIAAGIAMLMLNVGSRYVQADLGKTHELLLSNQYIKKLIVFCMFFVATRDATIAFLLTIFYVLIIDGILHEKRRFCLVPKRFVENNPTQHTKNEYERALEIVKLYEKTTVPDEGPKREPFEDYLRNIGASA